MNEELPERAAAEVEDLLQTVGVFVERIASVDANTKVRSGFLPVSGAVRLFAVYLWREFEVVRRRLPTAFLASVSSGGVFPGVGGLFPSRLQFALSD